MHDLHVKQSIERNIFKLSDYGWTKMVFIAS